MKKEMIETVVYEKGDVLDISEVYAVTQAPYERSPKKRTFNYAKRAIVFDVVKTKTMGLVYKVVCENGKDYTFKTAELGDERYIKHIDLDELFSITGETK